MQVESMPCTIVPSSVPPIAGAKVPTSHAQAIRLGKDESDPSWKKNCSRATWGLLRRKNAGWNVKLSVFDFVTQSGEVLKISYIKPSDLVSFLMTHHPSALVGGLETETERALHLEAFWEGFRAGNADHMAYRHHAHSLSQCLPLAWHGDEGRGKRRGNTVVISVETPFSVMTSLNSKKRKLEETSCCNPPPTSLARYNGSARSRLSDKHKDCLRMQSTTMKGNTFLHHFPLCVIPSSIIHANPEATRAILEVIAADLRQLFYEGLDVGNKHYTVGIIGAKGDLKWFKKIALERSWENQGVIRNYPCCHLCGAGAEGIPYEDVTSQVPRWAPTRFQSRPWSNQVPAMNAVPFSVDKPEKQYQSDPFHLTKVGIYRDLVGSSLCFLAVKGYFGAGDLDTKLANAHGVFKLFCQTERKTPALRTFSKLLMQYPRMDKYPWANVKGSDVMILLSFLIVQCAGFENAPLDDAHLPILKMIRFTCRAAKDVFVILNQHKLWLERRCAMQLQAEMTRFIKGYCQLAALCLNDPFNGFSIKPKLHLFKHEELNYHEALLRGDELLLSWNLWNCEMCEDLVGRVSRLSRRLDSRRIGERVLGCCLLKAGIVHRRFLQTGRL